MHRQSVFFALPLLAFACASPPPPPDVVDAAGDGDAAPMMDVPETPADVQRPDVPQDYVRPPPIMRTEPESVMAPRRTGCMFRAGAWPAETLGRDMPIGTEMPIDHVLILMQENRSFDHYFGRLADTGRTDVEPPPADWSNPGPTGTPVRAFHDTEYCIDDPDHGWNAVHQQYNNGAMDGFVRTNEPNGQRAMGFMTQQDIPFYYSLAENFAIGDRYFCSVLGPTWPNRMYLMAGTSYGLTENTLVPGDTRETPADHVFARMDAAGIDWRDYSDGPRMLSFYSYYGIFRRETRAHLFNINNLLSDLRSGNLPQVGIIEPNYLGNGGDRVDEHPPGMPQVGQAWVEQIVRALMASPAWGRTVLFITYDEHGGFADHVAPPPACVPDARTPIDRNGTAVPGAFDRLGVRVPFIAVSPYARRRFVSHQPYDHASVLRFVEARFGLPAMTARDANATPPMDVFDFANPPNMTPPTLAPSVVDPAAQARCRERFPNGGGL